MFRLLAIPIQLTTKCTDVHVQHCENGFIVVSFKLFGSELAEDGDQSKHVAAR